jgi:DNA polymerase III gamma/tau subunit
MSNIPFSVKYRPKSLVGVIGQEVVVQSLTNALKDKSLHHAYIFGGNLGCVLGNTKITVRKISEEGIHEIYTE